MDSHKWVSLRAFLRSMVLSAIAGLDYFFSEWVIAELLIDGFQPSKKLMSEHIWHGNALYAIADTNILTKMQKRGKPQKQFSP